MRKLRKCESSKLYTGISKCPIDFGKMKGAILVKAGTKLPADLTAEKLESLVHADRDKRVYGIIGFVEHAKNGGEVQTGATGYGPEQVTGISARKDTYDLDKFHPELDASLMSTANTEWDVYFIDEDLYIHGIKDGTDTLAGYPMSSVYSDSSPVPTSGAKSTMQVVFCHKDSKLSKIKFDYSPLGFDPFGLVLGILPVKLEKVEASGTAYKLIEETGGNDITAIYGPLIAASSEKVLEGATAVSYNASDETLTITADAGAAVQLKSPSVLFENEIKGIEQVS